MRVRGILPTERPDNIGDLERARLALKGARGLAQDHDEVELDVEFAEAIDAIDRVMEAAAIDVERLARALTSEAVSGWVRLIISGAGGKTHDHARLADGLAQDFAADIAREYEKLRTASSDAVSDHSALCSAVNPDGPEPR